MKRLKLIAVALGFSVFVAAPAVTLAVPHSASAATINCEQRFLGIPPWFRGMTEVKNNAVTGMDECHIIGPDDTEDGVGNFVMKLILNIIEIGLIAVGYVAMFFLLYGGFQFLTGGSNPSQIEKARTTMLNAVIGLGISFAAVAIINLVFGVLG